jgi:hypothetical protein
MAVQNASDQAKAQARLKKKKTINTMHRWQTQKTPYKANDLAKLENITARHWKLKPATRLQQIK